ncbi:MULTISPECIES: nickel/cobalt transporter [Glaesserella]|uniref:Nickel/cobalt efflux system n=1 Tax=Glaesserella australis TaxID=2094024 RepID=A0A328C3H4_9PAST|nr:MULTISPECIES: nickel/cobalt transporter [Glaesserella]AUI65405.1 cobalt transporter [Glaesserella sp. 15-184]RAL19600.1 cobalt transporter [Glaesserella australis]
MSIKRTYLLWLAVGLVAIFAIYQAYPLILFKVSEWQREFNVALSGSLNQLKENQQQAGLTLMAVSFIYGVFHAVGPGHGKFILSSYLSFEQTKLPQAVKITLLSALVQGFVAIALVTVIVVIFTLSRSYFNLTLKWVERGSFVVMALFGLYFCYQALSGLRTKSQVKGFKIKQLQQTSQKLPLVTLPHHQHSAHCGCGHKHLPSSTEIEKATDWKSTTMLIFSIGLRPCSGAILVLFLAYTLDLYWWGVFSALLMAVGTGLMLSAFAWIVLFARDKAVKAGRWYLSFATHKQFARYGKLLVGVVLIIFGITLFHSSLLDTSSNLLFKR